ncbi:fibronectin type 3 and ankyrin repeat domains 1 protein-like isoform X2 [Tribolium madens]|uniref:fibronectin type 3 and ankyrin repeat domains 1 protein-like isoform X2 n=1 Tax=Tribolium madens TaxID=41895 RepID=UPI001CF72681|nr:fibronectin type 3 and ankyrin repeat domains 1 protein-like isoform X2 [Tribolium madens]
MAKVSYQAINVGNLEMIDFYIKNNVVINYEHRDGTTPLIKAIRKGNFEVVKILFENGAHVNFKSSHGSYPLFEALKLDNCDIIKYLLSKEAKMNGKCLMKDNFQCVKNLIKYKIELKTVLLGDLEPSTLLKGVETKNALFVKYLLKQGLSINSYDDKQKSPLAVAVKNHSVLIVKILIDAGARIDSAKEELKELANKNDEFYIYYQSLKLNLNKPTLFSEGFGSGAHEAAD